MKIITKPAAHIAGEQSGDESGWYHPGIDELKKLGKRPSENTNGFFLWKRGDTQAYEIPQDWFGILFFQVTGKKHHGEATVYCNSEAEAMREAAIAFMRLPDSRQKELTQ